MSGPIVRTGTNPKFWEGWDKAFASKPKTAAPKKAAATEAAKAPAKKAAKKKA
jgi:hypothetical protein